jgi:hypothetical protein
LLVFIADLRGEHFSSNTQPVYAGAGLRGVWAINNKLQPLTIWKKPEGNMIKKIVRWFVFILSMWGVFTFSRGGFIPSPRSEYRKINFANERWTAKFTTEYKLASAHGEAWTRDPTDVALRLAGYPARDNSLPEKVNFERILDNLVNVTVRTQVSNDKTVRQKEIRVELMRSADTGVWTIVWAGIKQQCANDSLGLIWTAAACS